MDLERYSPLSHSDTLYLESTKAQSQERYSPLSHSDTLY